MIWQYSFSTCENETNTVSTLGPKQLSPAKPIWKKKNAGHKIFNKQISKHFIPPPLNIILDIDQDLSPSPSSYETIRANFCLSLSVLAAKILMRIHSYNWLTEFLGHLLAPSAYAVELQAKKIDFSVYPPYQTVCWNGADKNLGDRITLTCPTIS